MLIVSGSIRTSDRVASLSTSSAVTLPHSEEIRMRSCAIAFPFSISARPAGNQKSMLHMVSPLEVLMWCSDRSRHRLAQKWSKTIAYLISHGMLCCSIPAGSRKWPHPSGWTSAAKKLAFN